MLKFGDTYLNFGGTYLTDWDYHKEPVIENGWSELYNINSFKELTSSNSADYFERKPFGFNNAYIISAWEGNTPKVFTVSTDTYGNTTSPIIQTLGRKIPSSIHEDRVHIDDKNFTYLLYKFQIAPHSVGGEDRYPDIASSFVENPIYDNSNPIVKFSIGDNFSVENYYEPSAGTSVQMMLPGNKRFLCSSFTNYNILNINGTTATVVRGIYDYTIKTSSYFSAYIRPQTFNYLIKLNDNNIDVSAYINDFEQSATMNFEYSGTYDLNPSYFKESWKNFKIYGTNVGNWETRIMAGGGLTCKIWGYRSPIIEEVGLSAYYENELNYENFKNLALRSFTANYVPTVGG